MKLGAEPKKLAILIGLLLLGAYLVYTNVLSRPESRNQSQDRGAKSVESLHRPATSSANRQALPRRMMERASGSHEEFRPSLKPKKPGEGPDPMTIDPTLRLDLLAKVRSVPREGGERNLFQFATPPALPAAKPPEKPIIPGPIQNAKQQDQKPAEPAKPTAPPINLKFYGYSTIKGEGKKRAFFLDGDDILVAAEGETLKRGRYKVIRIGVNSVVMEDTQYNSQQTLPLLEQAG